MYSIQWNEHDYGVARWNDGVIDAQTSTAIDMLRDNKPLEEIIKYSHLPESRVLKLAQQVHK